jgi:ATP-binding cassette subfamily B multidrug efflux pump
MSQPDPSISNFRFFLNYAARHRWTYAFGVCLLLITNLFAVNIPQYMGEAIDMLRASDAMNIDDLHSKMYLIAGFAVLMIITRTGSRMMFFNPGRAVERDVKNDAFRKLTLLQRDFYNEHSNGKLISIVNNDVNGIRALAGVVTLQIFNILFALSLTPYKMWQLSPSLMLYCVIPVFTTFMISRKAVGNMRRMMKLRMQELQELSGKSVELLSGIDVIRNSHIRDWAEGRFETENQKLLDRSIELTKIRTIYMPLLGYTDRLIKVVVLIVGGMQVINAELSLGDLVAFLAYATLLAMPFFSMAMIWSAFHNGMISIASLRNILDRETSVIDQQIMANEQRDELFARQLEVRNLTYSYPGQNQPAIKNISFSIEPGQTIGILGQVGSGKSTLVNCLNNYLDVPVESVFIDGQDITQMARSDLRSAIRTVTQDPFLFSDSVENNVLFGSQGEGDLNHTLKRAAMDKEVAKFPQAQETMVGEKGILLSGGQKQRLSLARALYTPAKLLVLDNVLSAVDNDTERFLLKELFGKKGHKAAIIVSHRASVLERVDQILVLDEGEIIARGTHAELMQSSPLYAEIWRLQQDEAHAVSSTEEVSQ